MSIQLKLKPGVLANVKNRDIFIDYDSRGTYGVGTFRVETQWGIIAGDFEERQGLFTVTFAANSILFSDGRVKLKLDKEAFKSVKNRDIRINYDAKGTYGEGTFRVETVWNIIVAGRFVEREGILVIEFTERPFFVTDGLIKAFIERQFWKFLA